MSTHGIGGAGAPELLLLLLQRSNADAEAAATEVHHAALETATARSDQIRGRLEEKEGVVRAKEEELDEHISAGAHPLDSFFCRGSIHDAQTTQRRAEIEQANAEAGGESARLEEQRGRVSDSLRSLQEGFEGAVENQENLDALLAGVQAAKERSLRDLLA